MELKKQNTVFVRCIGDNETILFAGHELSKYIESMDPGKIAPVEISNACEYRKDENVIWLGLVEHFAKYDRNIIIKDDMTDSIQIDIDHASGIISGVNPRSVLLGVYQFLAQAGCRWIRPGESGEIIPEKNVGEIEVHISQKASYKHRGVCIEGASSLENVLDMVDWLPKIGCNSYFIQFRESFTFFERWYTHKYNPFMESGKFSIEDARALVEKIKKEIRKRGLAYHAVGHGWTCEPFGLEGTGWDPSEYDLSPDIAKNFALVNGKREVWQGIPINTNLCYSNDMVREIVLHDIAAYLEKHKEVDILHFWLADGLNNHCECENCVKITPSDIYVKMLNELDQLLTEKGIKTKIVFLIYFELMWPPQTERIQNEDRFILMFAPITRTYSRPFSCNGDMRELPPFIRNRITLPQSVEENLSFLLAWKEQFKGDSFDFDYHLYFDHYNDPAYYSISKILYSDIKNLKSIGLNGLVSCQVQRGFLPTAFPLYIMGKTLWDDTIQFEELAEDYFKHAFGADGMLCKDYLSKLSAAFNPPYLRNETEQVSREAAEEFSKIPCMIQSFSEIIARNLHHEENCISRSWKYLEYHSEICRKLAAILVCKANGDNEKMLELWLSLKEYVLKNEVDFQEAFDVQMFISHMENKINTRKDKDCDMIQLTNMEKSTKERGAKMQIGELCNLLDMPKAVQEKVIRYENEIDFTRIEAEITQMNNPNTWEKEREKLATFLAPDETGLKMLTCQLHAVCKTYEKYKDMGISDDVFVRTMKFFSRFLHTHNKIFGEYKYVWAWWAIRQISMQEFRIGELEYEMMVQNDKKVISIHIPSDTNMASTCLKKSYLDALDFFGEFYPEYAKAEMICGSWLLAPALKKLLPEHSRIMQFQKSFVLTSQEDDSPGILDWVYGRRDIPFENLPEETSLQRKLKKYLINGGKVEWANGTLISDPFSI